MARELKLENALTEAYITGINPNTGLQANVNVEDGEYVMTPEGSVLEVWGKKHKDGGTNILLPNMTAVLSDTKDLTITKKDVKKLAETYGLKGMTTKHTYSDVLDRYSRKIGRTKVISQLEDYFKQLKKQYENTKDETTLNTNSNFIAGKIDELQQEKTEHDKLMSEMFMEMFTSQQKQKPVEERQVSNHYAPQEEELTPQQEEAFSEAPPNQEMIDAEFQNPDNLSEREMFELGGYVGQVKGLAEKFKWTERKVYEHLKGKKLLPEYKGGGIIWDEFDQYQTNYQNLPNYRHGDQRQAERLRNILYNSGSGIDPTSLSSQSLQDQYAGQYQNWIYNDLRAVAEDYSASMAPTKKGLEYLINNGVMTNTDFEKLGVSVPKRAGQVLGFQDGDLSEDKIKEVNSYILDKLGSDKRKEEYLQNNFVDNKWFYRAPEIRTVKFDSEADRDSKLEGYQNLGNGIYKSKKTGLYLRPEIQDQPAPNTPPAQAPNKPADPNTPYNNVDIVDDIHLNRPKSRIPRAYWSPDQSVPPPTALQPETLEQIELQRLDPVRVGIEPTLRKIGAERAFVANQLESMPSSLRASVLASTVASSQQAESEAIMNAVAQNAQNFTVAEQFNIRQADTETTTNAQQRLGYEQRVLRGLDNYEQNIHNYLMANRAIYLNEYENQINLNRIDNLFPDVSIDMFGIGHYYDPSYQYRVSPNNNNLATVYGMSQARWTPPNTKTKKDS